METTQIKLLLVSMLTIVGVMLASIASAQVYTDTNVKHYRDNTENVRALFTVYVNDKIVPAEDYTFYMVCDELKLNTKYEMPEKFMVLLDYNAVYSFEITKTGYNRKIVTIVTKGAPNDNWLLKCNIYLYDDEPDQNCGILVYSPISKNFIHIQKE